MEKSTLQKIEIKVSVIIPLYNTQPYIRKCIESCLYQTLKEIEIIVVNDGSTDSSPDIVKEYMENHDNIYMISIVNSGLSIARNTGLSMAQGKYIYFLDSDDWIVEDCLEILYTQAEKHNLELLTFDSQNVGDTALYEDVVGVISRCDIVDATRIYTGKEFVEEYRHKQGIAEMAWTFFVRKSFLEINEIRFLPNVIFEDHKYHFDLLLSVKRMMYLPKSLHRRTCHENSIMTSGLSDKKVVSIYRTALAILCEIERKMLDPEETRFWLDYALYRLGHSIVVVANMQGQDYIKILARNYSQIEELQYQCILKHYELMNPADHPEFLGAHLTYMEQLLSRVGIISQRQTDFLGVIENWRDNFLRERLKKLPLSDKEKRVGIYGAGNHTKGILREYLRLCGEIKSEIVYIDTYLPSYTERIEWRDVINVCDINSENLDAIIISSYLHETEMLNSARAAAGRDLPIYTLYEENDSPALDSLYEDTNGIKKRILRYKTNPEQKRIFLVGTPRHTNIGDYLITFGVREFLKKYFSGYELIEVTGQDFQENKDNIWNIITRTDLLLIDGGGFFGSYWSDGTTIQMSLELFPQSPIVILPQTLYYEANEYGRRKAAEICKRVKLHSNLTICYREDGSLRKGLDMFGEDVRQYILPDMALLLHGLKRQKQRSGILLCLRNDIESVFTDTDRKRIAETAAQLCASVSYTSMHWKDTITQEEETEIVNKKLDELGTADLVITDALHCMVSCALIGVPCIALPSTTSKTQGVYEWIKELQYVRYVDNITSIQDIARELLTGQKSKDLDYQIDMRQYEAKLVKIISESWGVSV